MCGMCLPRCPTYQIYQSEAESPRGRIALIQALRNNQLSPDKKTLDHLNHCLGCLACETICPSKVPFGQIMDSAREMTNRHYTKPYLLRKLLHINEQVGGIDNYRAVSAILTNPLVNRITRLGLRLTKQSSTAITALAQLPPSIPVLKEYYPAQAAPAGSIGLFTGCMSKSFDMTTIVDSVFILTHMGYDVHIPKNQVCCGALHQRNGEPATAENQLKKIEDIFGKTDIDILLGTASACYNQVFRSNTSLKIQDIRSFLLKAINNSDITFSALKDDVLLHESCSSRSNKDLSGISRRLLQNIPGITLSEPEQAEFCCGAGGSQQILYPEQADALLSRKIKNLEPGKHRYLVSDNLGCSLHFKNGLHNRNIHIDIIHPVSLLARQLK